MVASVDIHRIPSAVVVQVVDRGFRVLEKSQIRLVQILVLVSAEVGPSFAVAGRTFAAADTSVVVASAVASRFADVHSSCS